MSIERNNINKYKSGFIGLVSMLITLLIIGLLFVYVYNSTNRNKENNKLESELNVGSTSDRGGAIQKAQDVKSLLEQKSREAGSVNLE